MDTLRENLVEIVIVSVLVLLLCALAYFLLRGSCLDPSLEKAYIEDTLPPLGQ